ncbi:hypothetical protein OKZ62_001839 [Vibrio navarrensis]|nr:hypothetical protein [Vibrio navarrensis]
MDLNAQQLTAMLDQMSSTTMFLLIPLVLAFTSFNTCRFFLGPVVFRSSFARKLYSLLGLFGIPLHEFAHLSAALLFGHKILRIKMFSWNSDAYVEHAYNPKSAYQLIGNFFVAIAPFIFPILLFKFVFPLDFVYSINLGINVSLTLRDAILLAPDIFTHVLVIGHWYEIVLFALVCFYCIPSNQDFKNAAKGAVGALPFLFFMIFLLQFLPMRDEIVSSFLVVGVFGAIVAVLGWIFFWLVALVQLKLCTTSS